MARPKKPQYEHVARLDRYRKRIKDADGTYVAIYGKTPEELTRKLEEARRRIENASYSLDNPTLSDYADRWMQMHLPNVSTGTATDYRYIIDHFIKVSLGHRRMSEITPDDIKLAMVPVTAKSASVHRKTVMLFKRIFESAADSGIISRSPCVKLKPGGNPQAEKKALTADQVQTLLDAISTAKTAIIPFVMIGLYAGLRREEIMGLRWENVTLTGPAPHISVRTALRWEHNRPIVSTTLKSPAARRDVPIPPQLVQCLTAHRAGSDSDYVFSGKDGQPKTESQFGSMWESVTTRMVGERTYYRYVDGKKVAKTITAKKGEKARNGSYCYTIDFPVSPHILRHTYITNLLLAGVDVKTVQYLAGHEHAKITMDIYAHLTYNKPEDIIAKVNKAFSADI